METTTPFCAGTPVRESSRGIRRFVLSPTRNFNPSPGSSPERFAEIVRHVIDEAMNGCLRDAMPGNRIHGPSQRAEGWFIKAPKIQLRFGAGQWVNGKVGLHEREETRCGRSFPFEL